MRDAVASDRDLRVVYAVHKKERDKYAWFFEGKESSRHFMETVDASPRRTLFRKIFRFFYAYLVYTGTTKVLTTMGMRADDPPAAANRHFSFVRVILANTLGRVGFVKRAVVPFLYLRVFRERPFQDLFVRYNPSVVFATNVYGEFDTMLLAEAKRRRVFSIAMPANWDHIDKYFLPLQADWLLAQNEQVKNAAVKYQAYKPEQIQLIGYPYFDFIQSPDSFLPRGTTLKYLRFPDNARYLLYVSGTAYCPDEPDIIETMLKWIDSGELGDNIFLVLRPYLGGRSKDKEFDRKKFEDFASHPRVCFYTEKSWDNMDDAVRYLNTIRHASVVMTVYSTAFLEAVVMDQPIVAAVFDGYKNRPYHRSIRRFEEFEHFKDFIKTGALKRTFNFDELRTALKNYFANPALDGDKRAFVRDHVCYKLDGGATRRVVETVLAAVKRGRPPL